MVIEAGLERDCHLLGTVFASVMSELKNSNGAWEDLLNKASKLQSAVKNSCSALSGFLDALQKIADMATNTKGATREIGSSLTRLCLRHRTLEHRLRELSNKMLDNFVGPMQDHAEDWRRTAFAIDKDHSREIKRARQDLKRLTNEALKAQKKAKKGNIDAQYQLDQLFQELSDRYAVLETLQRTALRVALREERARYCYFIACLKPMMEEEVAILDERNNVREILDLLSSQAMDPENLPEASEQAIRDLQGHQVRVWEVLRTKVVGGIDDAVGSDGGSLSRKSSSLCSIDDDDAVSNDSSDNESHIVNVSNGNNNGNGNGANGQQTIQHGVISGSNTVSRNKIQRKLSEVLTSSARMSTVAATTIGGSYDSGFMSQAEHYGHGGALMYMSGNVMNSAGMGMMPCSDATSGGSPESEPGIVMSAKSQQLMMTGGMMVAINGSGMQNGSATMRPHTISAAFAGQQQRRPLSPAVFEPPMMIQQQLQQQQLDNSAIYGTPADANGTTLLRLSKPVPPPRIPIRLNALDQPPPPLPVVPTGNDTMSNGEYAPIYANANELAVIAASVSGGSVSSGSYAHYHMQQQQQYAASNGSGCGGSGRRHRSASSSSGNDGSQYLELQPIGPNGQNGNARQKAQLQHYAAQQQMRAQSATGDELAMAIQQLECTVTQLQPNGMCSIDTGSEHNMSVTDGGYYQSIDGHSVGQIYASVPMPVQCNALPPRQQQQQGQYPQHVVDNTGTIRRAPSCVGPGTNGVKPTPPTRRGSTETLAMPPPLPQSCGRPPQQQQQQQAIYAPSSASCRATALQSKSNSMSNRTPAACNSAAAVAAVVDHALAVGSAHQNGHGQMAGKNKPSSPQTNGAPRPPQANPHMQLHQQFQQQLNQAISQRCAPASTAQQRHSSISGVGDGVPPSSQQNQQHHPALHPSASCPSSNAANLPPAPPASNGKKFSPERESPPNGKQLSSSNGADNGSNGHGTSSSGSRPSSPSSPQPANQLLAALQSKRQQLRRTTPNDRSAPKVGR